MKLSLIGLLALTTAAIAGTDLNAPLDEKPTIATEIKRGISAGEECHIGNDIMRCALEAASANAQRQPNANPFELGLFYRACLSAELALKSDKSIAASNVSAADDLPSDQDNVQSACTLMRTKQRIVKVTDEQLIEQDADRTPEARAEMLLWMKDFPK